MAFLVAEMVACAILGIDMRGLLACLVASIGCVACASIVHSDHLANFSATGLVYCNAKACDGGATVSLSIAFSSGDRLERMTIGATTTALDGSFSIEANEVSWSEERREGSHRVGPLLEIRAKSATCNGGVVSIPIKDATYDAAEDMFKLTQQRFEVCQSSIE